MIIQGLQPRPHAPDEAPDLDQWPFTLPPVAQLMREGLHFDQPVTLFVGENGSGKSTIIEAIAEAYGADVRGGHIGRDYASSLQTSPLGQEIRLQRTKIGRSMVGRKPRGYFLRAETAYGFFQYVTGTSAYGGHDLYAMSHGESFLAVFDARFTGQGLYLLDEPESALSFTSSLKLLALMDDLRERGSQVICATHSPLLAALPGAQILEVGTHGIRSVDWQDLELVDHWRRFLNRPNAYLRYIVTDPAFGQDTSES
jgi:predicted ATPase